MQLVEAIAFNICEEPEQALELMPHIAEGLRTYFHDYAVGSQVATVVSSMPYEQLSPGQMQYIVNQISSAVWNRVSADVEIEPLGPTNPIILGVALHLAKEAVRNTIR